MIDVKYTYETSCVNSTAEAISKMIERAQIISYDTFARKVDIRDLMRLFPFCTWGPGKKNGLRLKDDWSISCYRSVFLGRPCYYIDHSSVEYVFTQ